MPAHAKRIFIAGEEVRRAVETEEGSTRLGTIPRGPPSKDEIAGLLRRIKQGARAAFRRIAELGKMPAEIIDEPQLTRRIVQEMMGVLRSDPGA